MVKQAKLQRRISEIESKFNKNKRGNNFIKDNNNND